MIPQPDKGEVFVSASPGETIVPPGMQLTPRGGCGAAAPAGPSSVSVKVEIHVDAGKGGTDVASALSEPAFLGKLTKAIRQALVTQGVPTQGAP
jgi:hypothetical protein